MAKPADGSKALEIIKNKIRPLQKNKKLRKNIFLLIRNVPLNFDLPILFI